MSPRHRRLLSDFRQLQHLASEGQLTFRCEGDPPEIYHVMLRENGVTVVEGRISLRTMHRFDVYLHRDYPRRPPVVTWLTPIFHPNILGPERNGGVCLGSWSAAESLADLVTRVVDLVALRSFNVSDALDAEAARWYADHGLRPGCDARQLAGAGANDGDLVIQREVATR